MAKLFRVVNWYRPLNAILENGKQVCLNNIIIYDKNGIIEQTNYGYFDNDKEIEINGDIILKRKEDFTKEINFVISDKKNWNNETEYKIYIHKNNVKFEFTGFEKHIDTIMKTYTINGGVFRNVFKYLGDKKYECKNNFENKLKEISNKTFNFPFEQEELQEIFEYLLEQNKIGEKEFEKIKNFDLETLSQEKQKILERIKD